MDRVGENSSAAECGSLETDRNGRRVDKTNSPLTQPCLRISNAVCVEASDTRHVRRGKGRGHLYY